MAIKNSKTVTSVFYTYHDIANKEANKVCSMILKCFENFINEKMKTLSVFWKAFILTRVIEWSTNNKKINTKFKIELYDEKYDYVP